MTTLFPLKINATGSAILTDSKVNQLKVLFSFCQGEKPDNQTYGIRLDQILQLNMSEFEKASLILIDLATIIRELISDIKFELKVSILKNRRTVTVDIIVYELNSGSLVPVDTFSFLYESKFKANQN